MDYDEFIERRDELESEIEEKEETMSSYEDGGKVVEFDEWLDDTYGEVDVAGTTYNTSNALYLLDEGQYHAEYDNWAYDIINKLDDELDELKEELHELLEEHHHFVVVEKV